MTGFGLPAMTWKERIGKVKDKAEGLQREKVIAPHHSLGCTTEKNSQEIAEPTSFLPLSSVGGTQIHAKTYQPHFAKNHKIQSVFSPSLIVA